MALNTVALQQYLGSLMSSLIALLIRPSMELLACYLAVTCHDLFQIIVAPSYFYHILSPYWVIIFNISWIFIIIVPNIACKVRSIMHCLWLKHLNQRLFDQWFFTAMMLFSLKDFDVILSLWILLCHIYIWYRNGLVKLTHLILRAGQHCVPDWRNSMCN